MGIYKKALVRFFNHLEEEERKHLFWKLFDELLDRNKEKCAELLIYLADAIEDEN